MKNLFTLALLLIPTLLYAQNGSYTVTGKLAGVKAPAKAYLSHRIGSTMQMNSVQIQNGTFSSTGTVDGATMAALFVDRLGTGFSRTRTIAATVLYLEPGTITVSSPDSVAHAVVSGTPLNNDN